MIPSFSKILANFSGSTFTKGGGAGAVDAPQPMAVETSNTENDPVALSPKAFELSLFGHTVDVAEILRENPPGMYKNPWKIMG